MGIEVRVEGLTKSFGPQLIWQDVTLTLPPGEISVLLGPSGTGKSVFLKSLVGLIRPDRGRIVVRDVDLVRCSERQLYDLRRLYGVLFQDGALFGSMTLFDNIAFPLREHTRRSERDIREVVTGTMALVGLEGAEDKLPGEVSGGMRKRAGLARALVLEPEIVLFDEPDSGLDPVRVAYLNQLIVDLNARTDATFLIVTHDIGTARSVPDNLGLLFRRELIMFGPRELLLTSDEPVVVQFLNGRREGPIGMAEEKDAAEVEAELARHAAGVGAAGMGGPPLPTGPDGALPPQLTPSPGLPERRAVARRLDRVRVLLPTLPPDAQAAIRASLQTAAAPGGTPAPTPTRPVAGAPSPPDPPDSGAPTAGTGAGRMAAGPAAAGSAGGPPDSGAPTAGTGAARVAAGPAAAGSAGGPPDSGAPGGAAGARPAGPVGAGNDLAGPDPAGPRAAGAATATADPGTAGRGGASPAPAGPEGRRVPW